MQGEGAGTGRRATRWLWRAPMYLAGALIALVVAGFVVVLVGVGVVAAVRAVGGLPLSSAIIVVGAGPLVLAATIAAGDRLPRGAKPAPVDAGPSAVGGTRPGVAAVAYLYCRDGAVSSTQLEGCLNHVRVRDILERHTNAARFAEGRLHACLADAGPSCAHALLIANEAENEDPSQQLPRLQVG